MTFHALFAIFSLTLSMHTFSQCQKADNIRNWNIVPADETKVAFLCTYLVCTQWQERLYPLQVYEGGDKVVRYEATYLGCPSKAFPGSLFPHSALKFLQQKKGSLMRTHIIFYTVDFFCLSWESHGWYKRLIMHAYSIFPDGARSFVKRHEIFNENHQSNSHEMYNRK